jgi:GlcNAc-PI de-N-acetylase
MSQNQVSFQRQLLCRLRHLHVDLVTGWIRRSAKPSTTISDLPTIVFAPHQDDETLGCGGLIALKRSLGLPVKVIFLTNGDAYTGDRDAALANARRDEALNALAVLNVTPPDVAFWNYPDAQLRHLRIAKFATYYQPMPSPKSMCPTRSTNMTTMKPPMTWCNRRSPPRVNPMCCINTPFGSSGKRRYSSNSNHAI